MNRLLSPLILTLSLVGCGAAPNAQGSGGLPKVQSDELNQAAIQLDQQTNTAQSEQPSGK
jgi:hypothetical protein